MSASNVMKRATARTFSLTTNRQFQKQGKITLRRVQNDKTQTDPADTDKSPAKGLEPSDKGKGQPSGKKTERREKAVNANVLNFLPKSEVKP